MGMIEVVINFLDSKYNFNEKLKHKLKNHLHQSELNKLLHYQNSGIK